jgi:hypothetical protein
VGHAFSTFQKGTNRVLWDKLIRTFTMAKKNELNQRRRDLNGEIRRKNENTRIDTLRKTYGENFAHGYPGDAKLSSLLDSSGVRSLPEYLKRR